ncbi:MAG: MFS transporter [Flavobacteriaceae bacterium]|jgi:maltose/moltooligosaccharide transporter|nr:MFS transporter [Flavobacteriaceae bacterium]MCP4803358.1 SLC45 family MFS transporter [Bacteroidota bacterium]MDA7557519.1 MFS transporter [Flavobacteriaceae bacterium]MDC0956469.1 MFS transporter [Flavobacteriaceae bacterium]MDC3242044.1 MFS transporter [Flavobacteriaceae bacterium]|tara:strand:+ start:1106 stop:2428 length:1323 start_codon:yes stop_codon:yes gene_type:complete
MKISKPNLSFWQIFNMNVGFLGIQYSFGLQQTAINPIFLFLGASEDMLPILNIAGPVTGLIVQPIIGAMSDKTWSLKWGRRKPYFLIGALLGSICLFVFPHSPVLWFAVGLLWILDVGNNVAMEPYRAFVGDKLPEKQLSLGYQMQSLFCGLGTLLATGSIILFQYLFGEEADVAGTIPQWVYYSFYIGAILSLTTILWSVFKTSEIPPTKEEFIEINKIKALSLIKRIAKPFQEISIAVKEMPKFMWKIGAVYLFQWYALFVYWQFSTPLFMKTMGYSISEAGSQSAAMSLTYNTTTMLIALILVPLTLKFGNKKMYALSLFGTAVALFCIPFISDPLLVLIPMILFGIGWAAMMGIPYTMVSKIVPQERRGVYMGILNMMIVIPMGIETVTFGPIYKYLLSDNAINAMLFAGVFFAISAILAMRLNETSRFNKKTSTQ